MLATLEPGVMRLPLAGQHPLSGGRTAGGSEDSAVQAGNRRQ